tara:strand:+ start:159 stop:818 length:660 start_codon:yes stop_codon:yes gene_type:complete
MAKVSKKQRAIADRRMAVLRFKLRGFTNATIAQLLEPPVSERTVEKDVAFIRMERGDVFRKRNADEILAESEFALSEVAARAWEVHDAAPPGSGNRIKALSEVRNATADRLNLLGRVGVVQEQPKQVTMEITHLHTLEGFDDASIDAIEDRLLVGRLVKDNGDYSKLPKGLLIDAGVVEEAEFEETEEGMGDSNAEEGGKGVTPSVPAVPRTPRKRATA